ncbi:MAG: hypothetical protein DRP81_08015 [Candidatus Omnitrophota bacterium]|nr:DUF2934 domain-containing protein [Candidatus Omnitrophota bacterium]RKY41942.1 MAG: hypothetical protein DRP81_08015 [Candidatus Omnitrophota bacterium]HDN85808.1 DUF2934 domain-containing protein [Candidatus Omnitrophota bacterium]
MARAVSSRKKSKRENLKKKSSSKISISPLTLEKISECIRERAYYLWEEKGKPQGKDLDIWIKAEREILSQLIGK